MRSTEEQVRARIAQLEKELSREAEVAPSGMALSAAAADLYHACKKALWLLENHGTGKMAQTPAGDALRAAIAKAEGR